MLERSRYGSNLRYNWGVFSVCSVKESKFLGSGLSDFFFSEKRAIDKKIFRNFWRPGGQGGRSQLKHRARPEVESGGALRSLLEPELRLVSFFAFLRHSSWCYGLSPGSVQRGQFRLGGPIRGVWGLNSVATC